MKSSFAFHTIPATLLTILLFAAFTTTLHAQAKLSIQGFLKKSDGTALPDGEYSLKFRIYNVETGGSAIWTETQPAVEVTGGIYSAVLGSVTALNIPFTEAYFVSVAVGSGSEMIPRIPLTSAPYALSLIGQDNIFPSSGNVGIGAATPTEKLHVKNTASGGTAKILVEGPSDGVTELYLKKADVLGGYLGFNQQASGNTFRIGNNQGNLQLLCFGSASEIQLNPPSNGLVRIGGPVLAEQNVVARGGAPGASGSNKNGYAFAGNNGDNDSGLYCLGDGSVSLFTNNTERFTLNQDRLYLTGGMLARGGAPGAFGVNHNGYAFQAGGDDDSGMFSLDAGSVSFYADNTQKMRITSSDVYADVSTGTGAALGIQSDGRIVKATSSARYKENITPLSTDFSRLLQAEPKRYTRPGRPHDWEIGFIAEELDALGLKQLVVYDEQGRPDALMYDRMVVYIIPLLREQQQRIIALEQEKAQNGAGFSSLQAENAALREALNELRADVNALKAGSSAHSSNSERK